MITAKELYARIESGSITRIGVFLDLEYPDGDKTGTYALVPAKGFLSSIGGAPRANDMRVKVSVEKKTAWISRFLK